MTDINDLITKLEGVGYYANKEIAYAVAGSVETGRPLLVEGAPGVGKSSLAVSLAKAENIPLIRLQCYEGISPESVLYDYDYQRQLLVVSAIRDRITKEIEGISINEAVTKIAKDIQFFGEEFLLPRPILKALSMPGKKVLLIDEIDKASEEIEHTLLEALSDFALTIPELGTISCAPEDRPIVIMTSNRYRELSAALTRRCFYLYIAKKNRDEIKQILMAKVSADDAFCNRIADYIFQISNLDLDHPVSISEGIDWATFLTNNGIEEGQIVNTAPYTVGLMAKNNTDRKKILTQVFGATRG